MRRLASLVLATTLALSSCSGSRPPQTKPDPMLEYRVTELQNQVRVHTRQLVGNKLLYLYGDIQKELAFCLQGRVIGKNYYIDDIHVPVFTGNSTTSVDSVLGYCHEPDNVIGLVHNHPSGSCYPSMTDVQSFFQAKQLLVGMIICGADTSTGQLEYGFYVKAGEEK